MSLQDFWTNVKTGLHLDPPKRYISDLPRMNIADVRSSLEKSHNWLSPKIVRGYDESDIPFFSQEKRLEISENVRNFEKIAKEVKPKGSPNEDQVRSALPLLIDIAEEMEYDRFADPDAFRIGKTIEADPDFPHDEVIDARYRTTTSWNGHPTLRIMVYLPNSDDEKFLERAERISRIIRELVVESGELFWPRINCRVESDLVDLPHLGEDE